MSDPLTDNYLIRCSPAWRALVDAAAERAGQSTSAWLRDVAERAAETEQPAPPPGRLVQIERLQSAIESLHGCDRDDLHDALAEIGLVHGELSRELVALLRAG